MKRSHTSSFNQPSNLSCNKQRIALKDIDLFPIWRMFWFKLKQGRIWLWLHWKISCETKFFNLSFCFFKNLKPFVTQFSSKPNMPWNIFLVCTQWISLPSWQHSNSSYIGFMKLDLEIVGFSNNGGIVVWEGVSGDNTLTEFFVDTENFFGVSSKVAFDVCRSSRLIP